MATATTVLFVDIINQPENKASGPSWGIPEMGRNLSGFGYEGLQIPGW